MTIWSVKLVFVSVWFSDTVGVRLSLKPLTLAEPGVAVQVNNVPVTFDVSVMLVAVLLHIAFAAGEFERSGVGYTKTV